MKSADIVVIGAGVIGCSTAFHLARCGISDVVILERDHVGSGSSSKSAAMLAQQFCTNKVTLAMARHSFRRFMSFSEEMGASIDFQRTGWVYVATEESAARLRDQVSLLQSMGVTSELLNNTDLHALYPEMNLDDIVLGSWGPDDGAIDPHMVMWGYLKQARRLGVRLLEETKVTGIRLHGGRVTAVQTNRGPIACHAVVNAAGPWAGEVGRLVDVDVPIKNSARTVVVTDPLPAIPSHRPFVEDFSSEWYCRPEGKGMLMGMGRKPVVNPDRLGLDDEQVEAMIDKAMHRVPVFEEASVLTAWTGLRPLTEDGLPIVDTAPGIDGFLLNCGWGGIGIMMAPIAGEMLAELVLNGAIKSVEAAPLRLSRFGEGAMSNHKGTGLHV